jgi:hypothetical protein
MDVERDEQKDDRDEPTSDVPPGEAGTCGKRRRNR